MAKRKKSGQGLQKKTTGNEKSQVKHQNKTLRNILIGMVIIVAVIIAGVLIVNGMNNFEYKGVKFKTVKFCDTKPCLVVYQTSLPITVNQSHYEYNFYLRNDPRKLEGINFTGDLNLLPDVVINSKGNLSCNGDGVIAVANLANLYKVMGARVVKNESLDCQLFGRYMYLNIVEGNETKIEQNGLACYNIEVNNCEILKSTEKFMVETLSKVDGILNSQQA